MRVLVIEAPGLNLGYVGCYGNEWVATPTLDRLAVEGVVFDQHYADCPDSAGAHQVWQSGRYHFPVPEMDDEAPLRQVLPHFPVIRECGVDTFLVTAHACPNPAAALAGWQHVSRIGPASPSLSTQDQTIRAVADALDRLAAIDQWLLRVDFTTLLPPWHAPDEFRDAYLSEEEDGEEGEPAAAGVGAPECKDEDAPVLRLQNDFAAAVTYFDAGVGLVLDEIHKRGLGDDLLLIITADHGQELGARGMVGNGHTRLHEALIHVPLIIRLPGKAEAGRRISALTQTVDLLPTLLDAFGLPASGLHGHSLLPLATGKSHQIRAYACACLRAGDSIEAAVRTHGWFFLLPRWPSHADQALRPALYVKPDDRWEINDVCQHHLELAERLQRVLHDFVEATRQPGGLRVPELGDLEAAVANGEQANESTPTAGGTQP